MAYYRLVVPIQADTVAALRKQFIIHVPGQPPPISPAMPATAYMVGLPFRVIGPQQRLAMVTLTIPNGEFERCFEEIPEDKLPDEFKEDTPDA